MDELDPNNPREYIQKASATMDDEYSQKKGTMQNYYGIAHTYREPVEEQPRLLVNGRLKEYQVSRGGGEGGREEGREEGREGGRVRGKKCTYVQCVRVHVYQGSNYLAHKIMYMYI